MNSCDDTGTPARFRYVAPNAYPRVCWDKWTRPLAAIVYGEVALSPQTWPQFRSPLRPLAGQGLIEIAYSRAPVVYGQEDGFELAFTNELLFAGIQVKEYPGSSMTSLSETLYRQLLNLVDRRDYPYVLRTWNMVQDINQEQNGLERYRQFCQGRYEAISKKRGTSEEELYPAASAVGSIKGGLSVYCLAAKTPGIPVENPRQVSAYRYPPQYGPRSPSFSRGLVKNWSQGANLFLSGTASIVGHESRCRRNLAKQVCNAVDNLEYVIGAAKVASKAEFSLSADSAVLKAYIRCPHDYAEVRALLEERLGKEIAIAYLQADICRRELLFEIDGVVIAPAVCS